jgi:hypothetical protein
MLYVFAQIFSLDVFIPDEIDFILEINALVGGIVAVILAGKLQLASREDPPITDEEKQEFKRGELFTLWIFLFGIPAMIYSTYENNREIA